VKNDENWFTLSEIIVKIKWSTFLRHGIDSVETESKISVQIETYFPTPDSCGLMFFFLN